MTTRASDVMTIKIMWNFVTFTPVACYMTSDIKNFYACTPMDSHKFVRMPINLISQAFIDEYYFLHKAQNGYVYMHIIKGMYGLPQACMIANKLLK